LGKKLLIYKQPKKTNSNILAATKVGIDIDREVVYTIKKGDNLSTIAYKFDVSTKELKLWNNIDNDKPIQPGQKLKIVVNIINSEMK
jgi:membrane-bound lytic murein transglycosylase D